MRFFQSAAGMAASFVAMNEVYGAIFDPSPAEAATPAMAQERAGALKDQFIMARNASAGERPFGPVLRNGRSRACAASRFRMSCASDTASGRSDLQRGLSRQRSSVVTTPAFTTWISESPKVRTFAQERPALGDQSRVRIRGHGAKQPALRLRGWQTLGIRVIVSGRSRPLCASLSTGNN
jgi:hypothetical protein